MKNLILAFGFMMFGTFAYASTNIVTEVNENVIVDKVSNTHTAAHMEEDMACFGFTLSCGISGIVCGSNLGAMIDAVLLVDSILCEA